MVKEILAMDKARNFAAMKELFTQMNEADIAEEIGDMDEQAAIRVFRMLPKDKAADVFAYLPHDVQQQIVEAISDRELKNIVDDLFLDDAVDFIEEMPANVVRRILASVPPDLRDMINQLLQYPEDSAGSIMTTEYVELKSGLTVAQAFEHIRKTGLDKETIYTCYVIDYDRKLLGSVSARTLLLARQNETVGQIMKTHIISAKTHDDQETLAAFFRKYGLLAMPVVDHENRLVGIVTVDDMFEVQEEEATEDFELMAAMSPSEEPYLKASVVSLTKNRVIWLLLLMLSATVTGTIITGFEDALAVVPALVASIPMLMDTGGNAGAQSSTMVIRGMAVRDIELHDVLSVLWKELRVAALCGIVLAAVNMVRMMFIGYGVFMAVTVSLTLYLTVIMAKSVGCLLPLGAKALRLDPAVMAAPVITTLVDAGSLIVYFSLAKAILSI